MRVLITGITGFVGSHMAEYCLRKQGVEVAGTVRWRSDMKNISHIQDDVQLFECDMRDRSAVEKVLRTFMPDRVFHLSAQSFVGSSWSNPNETLNNNITSQTCLLESLRDLDMSCRVQVAGSSEEYGLVFPEETPISEDNPLRPLSPYAVSKVAQDLMGFQYYHSYGMFIVRTRAFNHEGPRRGEVFATSTFAKQAALVEAGMLDHISVGNLEAKRDFTDVRDMVHAYWLALERGAAGEAYNIGTGISYTMYDIIDILSKHVDCELPVVKDPARMRPSDVPILVADATKFKNATGWRPTISFDETMKDLLDYWRELI